MDVPNSFNSIIYATRQPSQITNLYQNLLDLYTRKDIDPILTRALENVVVYEQPVKTPLLQLRRGPASGSSAQECVVFTDDRRRSSGSPITWS